MKTISFLGFNVVHSSLADFVHFIPSILNKASFFRLVTLNPEIVMKAEDQSLSEWIKQADYILPDGIGISYGSFLLNGIKLPIITGIDFIQETFKCGSFSYYLVGATPTVVSKAVNNIQQQFPDLVIKGFHHGFLKKNQCDDIANDIFEKRPDIILVAMGFPKQEYFIKRLSKQLKYGMAVGVGGSFDILSGNIRRAPKWVLNFRIEWLYRAGQMPTRLLRFSFLLRFCFRIFAKKLLG